MTYMSYDEKSPGTMGRVEAAPMQAPVTSLHVVLSDVIVSALPTMSGYGPAGVTMSVMTALTLFHIVFFSKFFSFFESA